MITISNGIIDVNFHGIVTFYKHTLCVRSSPNVHNGNKLSTWVHPWGVSTIFLFLFNTSFMLQLLFYMIIYIHVVVL